MTKPQSAITASAQIDRAEATSFAPYAQLVKMLVPSSGCVAIYHTSGELLWCSDGYERPDFRELVESLKSEHDAAPSGQIRQTSSGTAAYSTALHSEFGELLGYVVIQLGAARAGSMAPSLLRPVLECLGSRIGLEKAAQTGEPTQSDDIDLLLTLDENDAAGASALQQLVAHCVDNLGCVSGAFLVPDRNLSIVAKRANAQSTDAAQLLDRTQKHLLAWAQLNNRPMVVNRVGTDAGMPPYKILSCPARDPENRTTGLLALFRSGDAPNFEVRDVRILEYMSRKAMSILNSQHDVLTGLMNRSTFERRVRKVIEDDAAKSGRALLYVDIDRLNSVNDAFGFHAGDEVIQRLAELIRGTIGKDDLACRVGGDRFAIFLAAREESRAHEIAAELLSAMGDLGYMRGGDAVPVSISIGLATLGAGNRDFDHLIAAAELACKRAQDRGRNRLELYGPNPEHTPQHEGELMAAATLRQALSSGEFRLHAQAIVDLYHEPGKTLGYEVLVRMCDPSGALLSPDKFMTAAERYGLMPALDKWVLTAVVQAFRNSAARLRQLPIGIALNVSAQSLLTPGFAPFVLAELEAAGLPHELFCFELKESDAANHIAAAEAFIAAVTSAGCHVALDDFGSGLSSLAHLKRLKVSYLKIDGALVRRIDGDLHAESLVRGLAKAAQTLGVLTVAEHVESAALAAKLEGLEVDLAQGYYYGAPVALQQLVGDAAPSPQAAGAGSQS